MNSYKYVLFLIIVVLTTSFKPDYKTETGNKPLKICVISDLNSGYGSTTYSVEVATVMKDLAVIKPDIILCAGDMVAGQKASLTDQNIKDMWAGFKKTVLDPIHALNIPFGFTMGNHDASPSFTRDRSQAETFWKENVSSTNLTFIDSANYPFYYSYIKNNVFFMSWDAAAAKVPSAVYEWMTAQLKSKIAKRSRLRVLTGHLPLYAIVDSKNKPGEVNAAPDSTLAFFKNNGVDVYISGHQHSYFPSRKDGVRLLNVGCIGDDPRPLIGHKTGGKKSYTIIEVPVRNAKKFDQKAYLPGSNALFELKDLPESVTGFNGTLKREDIQ